jgi:hypothetical protein
VGKIREFTTYNDRPMPRDIVEAYQEKNCNLEIELHKVCEERKSLINRNSILKINDVDVGVLREQVRLMKNSV